MEMIHTVYSLASALPRGCLRYGMATEESFQLLGEDSTSDLSANRKRKSKAAVENTRTGKSRRWSDAEVDRLIELLEERPCLWDVFCKEYRVREKRERAYEEIENELEIDLNDIKTKIVGLRSQLGRKLSKTNNKKSGQALSDDRSHAIFSENQYGARSFSKDCG